MGNESAVLAWAIVLGLVHVFVAAGLSTHRRGLRWNAGNRDGEPPPLSGMAARAVRANRNFLETFPFVAAALLGVMLLKHTTPQTLLGAQVWLAARIVYLPVYLAGIPYLRTAVWGTAFWGLLQIVKGLF